MSNAEEYKALWRQSAYEAVPYTNDYCEALLTLPEILDGSVGQGGATRIVIGITLDPESQRGIITVDDTGGGLKNVTRFLRWAASRNADNMHRNGHGMKKCMTKWEKEYDEAKWWVLYRKPKRDLVRIDAPFIGPETKQAEVEGDDETLMPSGTQWGMEFDMSILGAVHNTPATLAQALKEIIQTRYSEEIIQRVEFIVNVESPDAAANMNSREEGWHSFQWYLGAEVEGGRARIARDQVVEIPGGRWFYKAFRLTVDGRQVTPLNTMFPTYGAKNMLCSRVHIAVGGRMIEAIPVAKLLGGATHNRFNGWIEFVDFVADTPEDFERMPIPCTTKVSFYENGEVFKEFKAEYMRIQDTPEIPAAAAGVAAPRARRAPPAAVGGGGGGGGGGGEEEGGGGGGEDDAPPPAPAPAPAQPMTGEEKLAAWGISIDLDAMALTIRYGTRLYKHLPGPGRAPDRESLRRRVMRCENQEEAKKLIKAWVRLMA